MPGFSTSAAASARRPRTLIAERAVAVTAVTKVKWQIAMAEKLGAGAAPRGSVEWMLGDYTALDLPPASFQGAFSIEASCHAAGDSKEPFVRECARLLQPGAKLVVADGFMKRSVGMPRWYRAMLDFMTRSWAVAQFSAVRPIPSPRARKSLLGETTSAVSSSSLPL